MMDNSIGERIKKRRKELNITQTQIQENTSISSGNLSCIENGKYLPSAVALLELSSILDCSTDWILTGKSSISESKVMSDIEDSMTTKLISLFSNLSPEDKQELLWFAEMKYKKQNANAELFLSEQKNASSNIA